MNLNKTNVLILIIAICMSLLPQAALANEADERVLTLTEDWRLTDDLDMNIPSGQIFTVDGQNRYYIYEFDGCLKNTGSGYAVFKNTIIYPSGGTAEPGSLAALLAAAESVTSISSPAKGDKTLTLPTVPGFTVNIKSSSNTAVITTDAQITPPGSSTSVSLVLTLTGNGGKTDTKSISVIVPASSESSSSGGGGGGSIVSKPTSPDAITEGDTSIVTTDITTQNTGNTASATVSADKMTAAIKAAADVAESAGTNAVVEIKVDAPDSVTEVRTTIPSNETSQLAANMVKLMINTPIGSMTFDKDALQGFEEKATEDITFSIARVNQQSLSAEQQAIVGDRPVLDLSVISGSKLISDFAGGTATISISYELSQDESTNGIIVWLLGDNATLTPMECEYDPATKAVTFTTKHFSKFIIAYFPFIDVKAGEWYYEYVVYAYTNGFFAGTDPTTFEPHTPVTRGMLVTVLWRMEEEPEAALAEFPDVKQDQWYAKAIHWAQANGIVSGYTDGRFGPDDNLSREQLATILYRYTNYKGLDISAGDFESYPDAGDIAGYAKSPIQWAIGKGLISGYDGSLMPKASADRAQVAAIIQRYNENLIN